MYRWQIEELKKTYKAKGTVKTEAELADEVCL
jgi:hypothetical protein